LPVAAIALSPLTDFTLSGASVTTNEGKDVISIADAAEVCAGYFAGAEISGGPSSPLSGRLGGLPPLLVTCGSTELLRDDAIRFAYLADVAGVDVTLEMFEGMPHGFPLLAIDAGDAVFDRIEEFTCDRLWAEAGVVAASAPLVGPVGSAACRGDRPRPALRAARVSRREPPERRRSRARRARTRTSPSGRANDSPFGAPSRRR
jgi:virginiamycin B lyase